MLKARINQLTGEKSCDNELLGTSCQNFIAGHKSFGFVTNQSSMNLFHKVSLGWKEAKVNVWKVGRIEEN